jgi:hypothetical protein
MFSTNCRNATASTIAGNTSGALASWSRIQAPGNRRTTSQAASVVNPAMSVAVEIARMNVFAIAEVNEVWKITVLKLSRLKRSIAAQWMPS